MSKIGIDEIWSRLKANEGQDFETKTGLIFTFTIDGDVFRPSRTKYNLGKSNIRIALELVPFDGPGLISNLVRGSAYVWAVLHDKRVRRLDW